MYKFPFGPFISNELDINTCRYNTLLISRGQLSYSHFSLISPKHGLSSANALPINTVK